MRQIRSRIREKRGVDYTEDEIRELANVKLEKFLDPRGRAVRSARAVPQAPRSRRCRRRANYAFEDTTLYEIAPRPDPAWIRKLLNPILKLFFNPNPLIQALHIQSELNTRNAKREELDTLYYELIHNLVLETDAARHRGEEPEDAGGVDVEPARLRRAPGARARRASCSIGPAPPRRCSRRPAATAAAPVASADGRRSGAPHAPAPAAADDAGRADRGEGRQDGQAPGDRGRSERQRRGAAVRCAPTAASRARRTPRRSREARGRRPALRRRHQRRRGAARALHRGTAGAARRGRGRDHLRARLRHLAQRAAGRASSRCNGVPVRRFPVRARARCRSTSAGAREHVFEHAALDRRRAGLARERRAGEPGAGRLPGASARRSTTSILFSYRYYHAWHAARRAARQGGAGADRRARSGDRRWRSSVRSSAACAPIMYNSPEERAMIQAASGNADVPGVVVGVGSDVPTRTDPARFRRTVQDQPAVRDLHRPHRREQGLRRAVRLLPALRRRRSRAASTWC